MLFYVPLEPYVERYTWFMSCSDGWAENHFKNNNVEFRRIEGKPLSSTIKDGVVLDACGRSYYALSQTLELVSLINEGKISNNDTIYFEDFWHPGVETLFYIRHLKNMTYKIGTFIHAQSVDDTDFAYAMKEWMRPIEQGFGKGYDYIFTCSHILRQLCIDAGIGNESTVIKSGLPYNSSRLLEQLDSINCKLENTEDFVLFASRFDDEKDPMFFLDLVEACPDISFKLVNPRKDRPITSNTEVVERLTRICNKPTSNLEVVDTTDKCTYYNLLSRAKVLFNCADQDWVSWTLLEAITFKCNPLYPVWKDFPDELNNNPLYLYPKRDLKTCIQKLRTLLVTDFDTTTLNSIVERHDNSWKEYLTAMKLI